MYRCCVNVTFVCCSMVGLILSLVSPMIRKEILNNLPHELGLLIRTFPSSFTLRGEFDIAGTDLMLLQTELGKAKIFCEICEYSTYQMAMFYWLQKALDNRCWCALWQCISCLTAGHR